jgi:hypothetical protein
MSKLDKAPVVHGEPTNFFNKKPSIFAKPNKENIEEKPNKKRGRPKLNSQDKKSVKLSLVLSESHKEQLSLALAKYNKARKGDVFFTPPSMNEFVATLIFSNPELQKLLD